MYFETKLMMIYNFLVIIVPPHDRPTLLSRPQLAAQIGVEAEKLCSAGHQLTVQVVYGGTNIKSDVSALNRGCDILIATPGRLIDHLGMLHALKNSSPFLNVYMHFQAAFSLGFRAN